MTRALFLGAGLMLAVAGGGIAHAQPAAPGAVGSPWSRSTSPT